MGLAMFWGCCFIVYGPAVVLFVGTVAGSPVRVVIMVLGASLWLLSTLGASLLWYAVVRLHPGADQAQRSALLCVGAMVAVLLQELLRAAAFLLLRKLSLALPGFDKGLTSVSLLQKAFVIGQAFGLMSSTFSFGNILSLSLGPGIVGIHGDSQYFFTFSALQSLLQFLLHLCWTLLLFCCWEKERWMKAVVVVLSHMLNSALSFLNPLYYASLTLQWALLVVMAIWAWLEAGGQIRSASFQIHGGSLIKLKSMQYSALITSAEH